MRSADVRDAREQCKGRPTVRKCDGQHGCYVTEDEEQLRNRRPSDAERNLDTKCDDSETGCNRHRDAPPRGFASSSGKDQLRTRILLELLGRLGGIIRRLHSAIDQRYGISSRIAWIRRDPDRHIQRFCLAKVHIFLDSMMLPLKCASIV